MAEYYGGSGLAVERNKALLARRHFEVIAEAFRTFRPDDGASRLVTMALARHMADRLAETNPRFDRIRFLIACGIPRANLVKESM